MTSRAALRFVVQHDGAAVAGTQSRNLRKPGITDPEHVVHCRLDSLPGILVRRYRIKRTSQQVKRMISQYCQVVAPGSKDSADKFRVAYFLPVMEHFHRIFSTGVRLN